MKAPGVLCLILGVLVLPAAPLCADDDPGPDLNLLTFPFSAHFSPGAEFPGATGEAVLNGDSGKGTATIRFDFTQGGAYVALKLTGHVPAAYDEIRFSVLSETPATLGVRIVDSDGQQFQAPSLSYNGIEEWKPFRLAIAEIVASGNHFGGAKDGVLRPPIREIDLVVRGAPDLPKGKITFKDVLAIQ